MDRLRLLFLSQFPPSPATFGAQRRIEGLMASLARRHDLACIALISPELDAARAERAIRSYCDEVVLVPAPPWSGVGKRLAQLRSLASRTSFERRSLNVPRLAGELRRLLTARRYDVVTVEFPFLAAQRLSWAPAGERPPRLVLDEHNIEFELARQQAEGKEHGWLRRVHNGRNWPKIMREEISTWRSFDGVAFCSDADQARARAVVPGLRSEVVPNAVDVEAFRPEPGRQDAAPNVVFFGAINYFPNIDGVLHLLREIWPRIAAGHPTVRLKIIGQHPTPEILAFRGPRVEVLGQVDDLRAHLGDAWVSVAPLRIGGGTRFKILEAFAMERAVVSTTIGAEGIAAAAGRELLLEDDPERFADAVLRLLRDRPLAERLGRAGRALVAERYSWDSSARRMEQLYRGLLPAS